MKPETRFITSISGLLAPAVYRLKLNLPYTGGVADCRYEGNAGSIWAEYKYLPRVPPQVNLIKGNNPILTRLQNEWLKERWHNHVPGQQVVVIVGHPGGGVILDHPASWEHEFPREEFLSMTATKKEIAAWIEEFTTTG